MNQSERRKQNENVVEEKSNQTVMCIEVKLPSKLPQLKNRTDGFTWNGQ